RAAEDRALPAARHRRAERARGRRRPTTRPPGDRWRPSLGALGPGRTATASTPRRPAPAVRRRRRPRSAQASLLLVWPGRRGPRQPLLVVFVLERLVAAAACPAPVLEGHGLGSEQRDHLAVRGLAVGAARRSPRLF